MLVAAALTLSLSVCLVCLLLFLAYSSMATPALTSAAAAAAGGGKGPVGRPEEDRRLRLQQGDGDGVGGEGEDDAHAANASAHLFYYPWYGNRESDGEYFHWSHDVLPGPGDGSGPRKRLEAPGNIGANFYPKLGLYSSMSRETMAEHMRIVQRSGAGTLA